MILKQSRTRGWAAAVFTPNADGKCGLYGRQQAYTVMLIIRTSDGEIRWMGLSTHLKREGAGGKALKQIIFEGERFDALGVQNWRKKVLGAAVEGWRGQKLKR